MQKESPNMNFWQATRRFFEPVQEKPWAWIKASVQYTLWSIGPIAIMLFLKNITGSIETWDKKTFLTLVVWFLVFIVLYHITRICIKDWWWVNIDTRMIRTIYKKYLPEFIALENTQVEKIWTGRFISIIEKWFSTRNELLMLIFWKGNRVVVSLIFVWYVIGQTNSMLLFFFLLCLVGLHVVLNRINLYILANKRLCNPVNNEYLRSLVRIIMSKFEIMIQNKHGYEINKLDIIKDELYDLTKKRSLHIELVYILPELFVATLRIAMFLIVGVGIFDQTYSFADLVLFSSALWLMGHVMDLSSSTLKDFFVRFSDVEQLRHTFDSIPQVSYESWFPFVYQKGDILLQNISFSYQTQPILEQFSLTLQGGKKTAFVGESWGGKTTLIKLVAWYIQPASGEILVDGQNLSAIKLIDYYKHIGYLTQDPSVFDGTIYENLVYALDTEPTEEHIKKIITYAKCEFIREFEKWLETEIGERWVRLSGWQKQRLAIAKIMLKNPSIILLDEPTSALDSFNEEQISLALDKLFQGRTVILVAHRLQTVKKADKIFFLEQGKVVEEGTHAQLIKLNGKYKRMLDLQSGF